ncbi:MAG: formate--tetrahydrofolate ligase, partial [Actinomycetospora chiangmaiensis]|nr:formate--tetrahydrofolate ligase [Actinomycetospora chiangmaiensis]
MPSDIEIARAATLKPIAQVAEKLGIPDDALHNYGKHIAKIDHGYIAGLESRKPGK